jgi:hypothetical protein
MPVSDEAYQALCEEYAALQQRVATLEQMLRHTSINKAPGYT